MNQPNTKVAVITDTDSSLPPQTAEKYGIVQVPINIHFEDATLKACTQINDAGLFERIDREEKFPTTSAPSPGDFVQAFEGAFSNGAESVLCFTVSSEVSAVYNSAVTASQQMTGRDVTIIDSRGLSMAQGFVALAAARAAASGAAKKECIDQAIETSRRMGLYGAVYTLKYLAMSGRVGHLAAGLAALLDVKPVLTLQGGKLEMLEKVRTRKKAWERVIHLIQEDLGGKPPEQLAVLHVNALPEAQEFAAMLDKAGACPAEIIFAGLTPGLSAHTGPGMVGAAYVRA